MTKFRFMATVENSNLIKTYPDQGHVFRALAQVDAMGRVAQFFRIYVLKAA
jgi:hypothetical protein